MALDSTRGPMGGARRQSVRQRRVGEERILPIDRGWTGAWEYEQEGRWSRPWVGERQGLVVEGGFHFHLLLGAAKDTS